MSGAERREFVPNDRVVWQSDKAKSYQCPECDRWIRSQNEGEVPPIGVQCHGPFAGHTLTWAE